MSSSTDHTTDDPATRWDGWLDLATGSACVGCRRPGRLLCHTCAGTLPAYGLRVQPDPCPAGLAACAAAGEYSGLLRAMVLAHKERGAFALARPLGAALAVAAEELVADRGGRVLLVPVPSRRAVVAARGHDPMLRVVRRAAARLRSEHDSVEVARLLRTTGAVADQSGLDAGARLANLAGSMAVRTTALRALARTGHRVTAVVCDDVLTTGATAREAQRALAAVGVPVAGVAVVAATRRHHPSARP